MVYTKEELLFMLEMMFYKMMEDNTIPRNDIRVGYANAIFDLRRIIINLDEEADLTEEIDDLLVPNCVAEG